MNKKRLIVIISFVVAVCLIISGIVWVLKAREDKSASSDVSASADEISLSENWLGVKTVAELEELALKTDKEIEVDLEDVYVSDLPFGEGTATYGYRFNENEEIIGISIGYVLVASTEAEDEYIMEDITAQELMDRTINIVEWISANFDVEIGYKFYIYTNDGVVIPTDKVSSYQKILDGTATMELRILDVDESVWMLTVERIPGYNIVSCIFEHFMSGSEEAEIPCNVAIQQ